VFCEAAKNARRPAAASLLLLGMAERAFFKLRVKPGGEQEYVKRHKAVWPQVQSDLVAAGVKEMSIWMHGRDVFLLMVCANYKAAVELLDASPESVKWEQWMAPMMETAEGDEYDPEHAYPDGLPEVWRWEAPPSSSAASSATTAPGMTHPVAQVAHDCWLAQTGAEPVLHKELKIVDAHHHLWDKHPSRSFVGRYMVEELTQDILSSSAHHNIVATCYMQSSSAGWRRASGPPELRTVGEVEFVMGCAAMGESGLYGCSRICAGIVGTADLMLGEAVDSVLEASIAAGRNFRGVRFRGGKAETIPFDSPEFLQGLRALERRGLIFDCNGPETHPLDFQGVLGGLLRAARACPELTIVCDHCGGAVGPRCFEASPEKLAEWREAMRALAACPNVFCKVGGLAMAANGFPIGASDRPGHGSISSLDLLPLVAPFYKFVIETFGCSRCLFESNFPVDKWGVSYVVLWNTFKRLVDDMELEIADVQALFSGTASRVYRLDIV
jgi:L-fuconolactonase